MLLKFPQPNAAAWTASGLTEGNSAGQLQESPWLIELASTDILNNLKI